MVIEMNLQKGLILILSLASLTCIPLKKVSFEYEGIYVDKNNEKQLEIKANGTFNMSHTDDFLMKHNVWRLKSISTGTWEKENQFLILNTDKKIQSKTLDVKVIEKSLDNDSLIVNILNPYEQLEMKSQYPRVFNYSISFGSTNPILEEAYLIESSKLTLPKINNEKYSIYSIWIDIVPDALNYPNQLAFNYLTTGYIELEGNTSNYFEISIPDLTLEYIGYVRFKEEYVKIIDMNSLQIRGESFKKK
jgi:hypothetical protein